MRAGRIPTGNVIDPLELVDRYGVDQVRYFLLREVPFGRDGDFSHRAMVSRMNNDLANDFGNLVQRVLSMVNKNCGSLVPEPGPFDDADKRLLDSAHALLDQSRASYARQEFHIALVDLWKVIGAANRYVDEQAPWALRKADPSRMGTVLYVLAETIRRVAILAQPVTPLGAGRILDQLAVAEGARSFAQLGTGGALRPGTRLPKPEAVFPRLVEAECG